MASQTAKDLARDLREGRRDPVDEVQAVYDRIAAHGDAALFIRLTRDRAEAEARAARERLRAGNPASLLDGVPLAWKDLLDPRLKGRIALYNDGIGFHFPAQVAGGGSLEDIPANMQPAWDFIAKMKEQAPLLGEDPDFTTWFQNGEIDAACTISTNALAAKRNGIDLA